MIITEQKRNQIMSYIVHAWEILQKEHHLPEKPYKYLYIPKWPELYTSALKSAWYLFFDKNIKKITIITEQDEYPKEIISYINQKKSDFLIWWNKIKSIIPKYIEKTSIISNELFDQLLYLRLLTKIKTVSIIGIWKSATKTKINWIIKDISKEDWIVVLWNLSQEKNKDDLIKEDEVMIQNILLWTTYKKKDKWIWNIYKDIVTKNQRKSELLVYVNGYDIWIKKTAQIWYVCIVA